MLLIWSRAVIQRGIMFNIFEGIKIKGVDKDGQEKDFSLAELGQNFVLYFYPKDNGLRCTQEAREFRDKISQINPQTPVIGVSPDSVEKHKEFFSKNSLNFPLLSDTENQLARHLGVWKEALDKDKNKYMTVERSTFIIKNGLISKAWKEVQVDGHVDEVIKSL